MIHYDTVADILNCIGGINSVIVIDFAVGGLAAFMQRGGQH